MGTRLVGLVGHNWLAGNHVGSNLDEVGEVHDTSLLNEECNPQGEGHEMVVDVVKHTVRGIDLRSQLSNDDIGQHHGNTRFQKDLDDHIWHVEDSGTSKRSSTQGDTEVNKDNHELTTHQLY